MAVPPEPSDPMESEEDELDPVVELSRAELRTKPSPISTLAEEAPPRSKSQRSKLNEMSRSELRSIERLKDGLLVALSFFHVGHGR